MHGPDDVLPADRALVHPLAALGAGDHVTALQENTVDHGVHADPAEVVVVDRQRTLLTICETKTQRCLKCNKIHEQSDKSCADEGRGGNVMKLLILSIVPCLGKVMLESPQKCHCLLRLCVKMFP